MFRITALLSAALCIESMPLTAQGVGGGGAGTATGAQTTSQPDSIARQDMLPSRLVEDVTSVFNSKETMRVRGDGRISADSVVPGNIAVLRGDLRIAGRVRGRVIAINGNVYLESTAMVDQDILVVGGTINGRENGRVRGRIRYYRTPMMLAEESDTIVADPRYSNDDSFWSRYEPGVETSRSKITVRGDTYNRIEGLPILVGPSIRLTGEKLRANLDALGIIRTAQRARWDSENIGHKLDLDVRMNRDAGIGIGGSLFDVVDPIETWHFSDHEAGLATFLLHRDFRDYHQRHGGALNVKLFGGFSQELEFSFGMERWRSRDVRDTWTVFRDDDAWRPNPLVHEGSVHIASATFRADTRNSESNPWSGWLVNAQFERGQGQLAAPSAPTDFVDSKYSRMMLDLRRYNRITPGGQLNVRLVYGGRLGDDELPMQKRLSVGGPGSLPGFDFRRTHGGTDVGMCSTASGVPAGRPAMCERVALLQLEYRGDVHVDLFNGGERDSDSWRDVGNHPHSQWVVFVDGGRGWLLHNGPPAMDDGLMYSSGTILPGLSTFRTDVGIGLDMGPVGIFVAKAISQSGVPANFFVRLGHRF